MSPVVPRALLRRLAEARRRRTGPDGRPVLNLTPEEAGRSTRQAMRLSSRDATLMGLAEALNDTVYLSPEEREQAREITAIDEAELREASQDPQTRKLAEAARRYWARVKEKRS